jgi:small Trp-rich protein
MAFVIVGTILLALKLLELDLVANLSWFWVLAPFGAAVLWWAYADSTGLTQRRAMKRMEERKIYRRQRDMAALGLGVPSDRRKRASNKAADEGRARAGEGKGDGPG